MRALPLWQPWASLVVVGVKRVETRHWPAPATILGQRIAIHATKTTRELAICAQEPFQRRLDEAERDGRLVLMDNDLPLGAIVGTVVVDRCTPMTEESIAALAATNPDEYAFGLYEVGRFAWVLRDPQPLAAPIPYRGSQGIFDVPDHLFGPAPIAPPERTQGTLL